MGESKHSITTGYSVGDQWELIAGKDAFDFHSMGNGLFNTLYEEAPQKILYRVCATCVESHQHIYYKRLSDIPDGYDLLNTMNNKWSQTNNVWVRTLISTRLFRMPKTTQMNGNTANITTMLACHTNVVQRRKYVINGPKCCGPAERQTWLFTF